MSSERIDEKLSIEEFQSACRIVENVCRSLGNNCEIMFYVNGVSVAPSAWPGDSTGTTLFDALLDALQGD